MALGLNMLYVAFSSFCYSMAALWIASYWTRPLPESAMAGLIYRRAPTRHPETDGAA